MIRPIANQQQNRPTVVIFTAEHVFTVGDTVNVHQVSTFDMETLNENRRR